MQFQRVEWDGSSSAFHFSSIHLIQTLSQKSFCFADSLYRATLCDNYPGTKPEWDTGCPNLSRMRLFLATPSEKTNNNNNCGTLYLGRWWQAACGTNKGYATFCTTPPCHQVFLMERMRSFYLHVFFFSNTRIEGTHANVATRLWFKKKSSLDVYWFFIKVCLKMSSFHSNIQFMLCLLWWNLTATTKT